MRLYKLHGWQVAELIYQATSTSKLISIKDYFYNLRMTLLTFAALLGVLPFLICILPAATKQNKLINSGLRLISWVLLAIASMYSIVGLILFIQWAIS
jgi:hypothetical protein